MKKGLVIPMEEFENDDDDKVIDLSILISDLLRGVKKFWWVVILLSVITAGFTCYMEKKNYHPYYTASATFTVTLKSGSDGYSIYEETVKASLMSKTFPYIIMNGLLKDIVADDLGLDYLSENITAENIVNTNLFTINVSSDHAERAYKVLQSVIKNYPKIAEPVVGSTHLTMLDQTGIPKEPDNGLNYKDSILKGMLPGLGLGIFLLILYAYTRRTIHKEEDLIRLTNLRNLGTLPEVTFKKRGNRQVNLVSIKNEKVSSWYKESIYKIRTRVDKVANNNNLKSILVTSAVSGEGKSTFAFNLALAMAEQEKKVVLMDCDLHKPSIANMVSLAEDAIGLEQVLYSEAELFEAIHYLERYKLSVLAGMSPTPNASEIIGASKMKEILKQLEENYDIVIIDTAPSAVLSDTIELARIVDGLIYVVKQDYAKVNQILESLENLGDMKHIDMIGCVLNGVKTGITGFGYGYGYGYGYGSYGRYGSERRNYKKEKMKLEMHND